MSPPYGSDDHQVFAVVDTTASTSTTIGGGGSDSVLGLSPPVAVMDFVEQQKQLHRVIAKEKASFLPFVSEPPKAAGIGTVTKHNQMRTLSCVAQQYAWGRVGSESTVARMKDAVDSNFIIDEMKPYAELWVGTHPSGMSQVVFDPKVADGEESERKQTTLLDYVQSDASLHCGSTGDNDKPTDDLTFLLKILSVNKVLSIQSHPDKRLAERLHSQRPSVYKDPNHKPEMAIAISTCRAMCGFRPLCEIVSNLKQYPEFRALIGSEAKIRQLTACLSEQKDETSSLSTASTDTSTSSFSDSESSDADSVQSDNNDKVRGVLRRVFRSYMQADESVVSGLLQALVARLSSLDERDEIQDLILNLYGQFPDDIGVFAPLLLNIVTIQPGQALFIGANEAHAYIEGEMIECMACSDNVVRAGLTPKLKDTDILVNMLTYQCGYPTIIDLEGGDRANNAAIQVVDKSCLRYQPPVQDFCVDVINVTGDDADDAADDASVYELPAINSPSILLMLDGDAVLEQQQKNADDTTTTTTTTTSTTLDVSFGSAVFLSANTSCKINAGPYGAKLTRAYTNVYYHHQNE